jgi:hypothetical protein
MERVSSPVSLAMTPFMPLWLSHYLPLTKVDPREDLMCGCPYQVTCAWRQNFELHQSSSCRKYAFLDAGHFSSIRYHIVSFPGFSHLSSLVDRLLLFTELKTKSWPNQRAHSPDTLRTPRSCGTIMGSEPLTTKFISFHSHGRAVLEAHLHCWTQVPYFHCLKAFLDSEAFLSGSGPEPSFFPCHVMPFSNLSSVEQVRTAAPFRKSVRVGYDQTH